MLVCTAINKYISNRQTNANKAFKVPVITLQNSCPPKIKKKEISVQCNNFPPITVDNLFKFSVQGSDLALFIRNGTKGEIPSAIKPPLGVHYIAQ